MLTHAPKDKHISVCIVKYYTYPIAEYLTPGRSLGHRKSSDSSCDMASTKPWDSTWTLTLNGMDVGVGH